MKFRHLARRLAHAGAYALAILATLCMAPVATAAAQADVQLQTDLQHLSVQINQGAPLPPGGCTSGHTWHTTYGGCRRTESRAESGQCPAGWSGTRVRYRTAYILQANSQDVAFDAWGPWQDSCTPPRRAGVVDTVIATARGAETGDRSNTNGLTGDIARAMRVNYGTLYGVTIYRPNATLNCVYASGTTAGDGESSNTIWYGALMAPGQSYNNGDAGHCLLSNAGQSAEIYGSCDTSTGGDGDFCQSGTRTVSITATTACSVTTETVERGRVTATNSFNLC